MDQFGNLNAKERAILSEIQAKAFELGHTVVSNKELGEMRQRANRAACLTSSLVRSRHAIVTEQPVEAKRG
jgi:hypothetical protein